MKKILIILALSLLISAISISNVVADTISGSTSEAVTFAIDASSSSAYIVLSSSTGLANVAQHNAIGVFLGYGEEKHHGFYRITMKSNNITYGSFIWAPSATTNKDNIDTCEEIKINFPSAGKYSITVDPLSNSEAMYYWRVDWISSWKYDARWLLSITSGCEMHNSTKEYDRAEVSINYFLDGNLFNTETMTITNSQTINPKAISGYDCLSSGMYVTFDKQTGKCSPSSISFEYKSQIKAGRIYVKKIDIDTGKELSSYFETVDSNMGVIGYGTAPDGYSVAGDSYYYISVADDGTVDPISVSFFFRKNSSDSETGTSFQETNNDQNNSEQDVNYNQQTHQNDNISPNFGSAYDIGIPNLQGRIYSNGDMNVTVLWVQCQMKATGEYYQGDNWDETGNLGNQTMKEIARFMKSRGYGNHSGNVDQNVIDELASYLGNRRVAVYVGGFYDHMNTIMRGGSAGSMESIVSNMRDGVARTTTGARWVQTCLAKLGYYNSSIDGKYGQGTENAVNRFQRDYGFVERDYVSLGVARAMLEACYKRGYNLNDLP